MSFELKETVKSQDDTAGLQLKLNRMSNSQTAQMQSSSSPPAKKNLSIVPGSHKVEELADTDSRGGMSNMSANLMENGEKYLKV